VCLGLIRLEGDCPAVAGDRISGTDQPPQRTPAMEMGFNVVRLQRNRAAVAGNGFFIAVVRAQRPASVVVCVHVIGVQCNRLVAARDRVRFWRHVHASPRAAPVHLTPLHTAGVRAAAVRARHRFHRGELAGLPHVRQAATRPHGTR
jgi:hypothetical protein